MKIAIGNWTISKASEDEKTVRIRLVANRLKPDKEDEQIIPSAFNKATVDRFLGTGIIDWHHQSVVGKTPEQRAGAILGRPTDFRWETNLPVVYGELTKAHPIVRDSILPHLEAGQPVFGASIGGSVLKAEVQVDPSTKKAIRKICEIDWNHIAIAASPYVMSPGSEVSMVKASGEIMVKYSDLSSFDDDFVLLARGENLRKALEVGAGTDIAALTGVDAFRGQSLEGGGGAPINNINRQAIEDVLNGLREGIIEPSRLGIETYLIRRGFDSQEVENFLGRFVETVQNILGGNYAQ